MVAGHVLRAIIWAGWAGERGQASLLLLGVMFLLLVGAVVVFAFG